MGNLPSFSYNGFEIWCVFEAGLHLDQSHFKYSVALCGRGLPYWLKKWDTKINASRHLKTGIDTDVDMETSKMSGVCFPILWKNLDLVGKSNNFSPSLVRVLLWVRKLVECWNFPPGTVQREGPGKISSAFLAFGAVGRTLDGKGCPWQWHSMIISLSHGWQWDRRSYKAYNVPSIWTIEEMEMGNKPGLLEAVNIKTKLWRTGLVGTWCL